MFGRMVGDTPGLGALAVDDRSSCGAVASCCREQNGNPLLTLNWCRSVAQFADGRQFRGQRNRFGVSASALFVVITTDASCGAISTMHDSPDAHRGHDPDAQHSTR
jgi:K+-transporting ATPase ATPase A chain